MDRSYSELIRLRSFEERFKYLSLRGIVGRETFGFDRYLNQTFYRSREWKRLRNEIIVRDNGCDMGLDGFDIHEPIYIHHLNPMTVKDVESSDPRILDPDNLISVTLRTHNAIHYGEANLLPRQLIERGPGDTKLW
jgi:hypothetical protein